MREKGRGNGALGPLAMAAGAPRKATRRYENPVVASPLSPLATSLVLPPQPFVLCVECVSESLCVCIGVHRPASLSLCNPRWTSETSTATVTEVRLRLQLQLELGGFCARLRATRLVHSLLSANLTLSSSCSSSSSVHSLHCSHCSHCSISAFASIAFVLEPSRFLT